MRILKTWLYEFNVSPSQLHTFPVHPNLLDLTSVTISGLCYGSSEYSKLCQGLRYCLFWQMLRYCLFWQMLRYCLLWQMLRYYLVWQTLRYCLVRQMLRYCLLWQTLRYCLVWQKLPNVSEEGSASIFKVSAADGGSTSILTTATHHVDCAVSRFTRWHHKHWKNLQFTLPDTLNSFLNIYISYCHI